MKKYLLILFLLLSLGGFAQQIERAEKKDVRVGLVLSGGGAKGFAHVGVLKVLEEAGIRVDYIAGTSMGSIVGGLYASGYTASELDSILKIYDFNNLIKDDLPRSASSFYQKENIAKYAISLPIHKKKIGLPSAISKGQNVFNLFSELTKHVDTIEDFSKLYIPFLCVATDLETGEEVVLDHGFLPEAIRASGSFPSLLAPVEVDGRILIDGGIVDNYPIEKLQDKGLDYIIGVDVQGKLKHDEDLKSAPDILMQIAKFQIIKNIDKKIKMTDVYLKPDITGYNDFSFDDAEDIVKLGEDVARKNYDKLLKIASQQTNKRVRFKDLAGDKKEADIVVKAVEFRGNEHYTDKYLLKKLGFEIGETISQREFVKGINALTATGDFDSILYRFTPVEGGSKIVFSITENDISAYLRFGIHYDEIYKTGVLVNVTKKHIVFKNDYLSADLVIGDKFRYNIDYFLDNGLNWSFGLNTRYNFFKLSIPTEIGFQNSGELQEEVGVKIPVEYNDFSTQLFLQTTFKNNMALRIGAEHKFINSFINLIVDDERVKNYLDKSNYFNLFAKATFDSYDKKILPKKGFYFDANYRVYLFSSDYYNDFDSFSQLYGTLGFAYTIFKKLTFHVTSDAGITIGSNNNVIHDYHLGGNNENYINTFIPFYGYEIAELNDVGFLKTALTVRYEIFKKNHLSFTGNFARLGDDLWNGGSIFADTDSGYAFGYSIETFIGPIELKYSWSPETNRDFWYFNLGFWF